MGRKVARSFCWAAAALMLALSGLACKGREAEAPIAETSASAAAPEPQAAPAPVPMPRRLVRTVDLEIEVRDPEKVSAEVQGLAGRLGGYVSGVDAHRQEDGTLY
ncbi:MAG TPA: hypothetical protein VJ725_11115, partial [Thermoanaerobaculia bacterium]|nr:hypothetical protein [Thermoanaerobaculia bacterium]